MLVFCYEPSQSSHKIHSCSFESAISKGISVKLANKTCFILPQNLQTPTHLNYFISILSAERFMILFLVAFRSFNTRWKLGYNYGVNSKFPNTRFTIKMVITQETYRKVITFFFSFFHKTFLTHFLIFWKILIIFFFLWLTLWSTLLLHSWPDVAHPTPLALHAGQIPNWTAWFAVAVWPKPATMTVQTVQSEATHI